MPHSLLPILNAKEVVTKKIKAAFLFSLISEHSFGFGLSNSKTEYKINETPVSSI